MHQAFFRLFEHRKIEHLDQIRAEKQKEETGCFRLISGRGDEQIESKAIETARAFNDNILTGNMKTRSRILVLFFAAGFMLRPMILCNCAARDVKSPDKPEQRWEINRSIARRIITRTVLVIKKAYEYEKERREKSPGLLRAIRHNRIARLIYLHRGSYHQAVRHSLRARMLARQVIITNRGRLAPDDKNSGEEDQIVVGDSLKELDAAADREKFNDSLAEKELNEIPGE